MKPAPFAFARPASLDEAVELLAGHADAKVLAGGQSLVPLLSMRLAAPAMLIDINAIPDLSHVRCDADGVRVGALARHNDVLGDRRAGELQPLLPLALRHVAHHTIRNRGTTVGSLVHADAAAEMPAVLVLLDGSLDVVSTRGRRTIAAADLYAGPLESTLEHDEIAVEAFFPALPAGAGGGFEEVARRHGDYAVCAVAAVVARSPAGVVSARASYVSVNDVPTVVDLSDALAGLDEPGDDAWAAAAELALAHLDPQPDLHATADYRAHLVRVLTRRALRTAALRAVDRAA